MANEADCVRRFVVALIAAACLTIPAGRAAADDPPVEPPQTVDRETAEAYDEFTEWVRKGTDQAVRRMTGRYELDEDQQTAVRETLNRVRETFMSVNGPKAFDLYQRGKALGEMMREQRMGWQEVPVEVRQDLARRVLPLMDALEKQLTDVGAAVGETLTDQQRERFVEDQLRMQRGFAMARTQIKLTSGQWTSAEAPPAGGAGPADPGASAPQAPLVNLDAWERYVRRFIQRHRLDEVQKLRAMDLLAEYRGRAGKLLEAATAQVATRPAGQATTAPGPTTATAPAETLATTADFRARLEQERTRRGPYNELFEQLKAELEKIPSDVQRKLAEDDDGRSRRAPGPGGGRTEE